MKTPMKSVLKIGTLAALLAAAALPPPARAVEGMQAIASIRDAAARYVQGRVSPGAQVDAAALDSRVQLPACDQPLQAAAGNGAAAAQWNVAVSCNGSVNWTLYVPVRVADRQTVVVLARNVYAGQTLTADALRTEVRDTAAMGFGYVGSADSVIGKQLRRPLAAGTALTPDVIAAAPVVRRGQAVSLIGRAGSFEVRAEGRALADGAAGQRIAVENASSRRTVQGVVREDGSVEVAL